MDNVVEINLDLLVLDEGLQPRSKGVSKSHVQQLLESDPADWPPIHVSPNDIGDGTYLVIDGWHRITAGRVLGLEGIRCIVLPDDAGYPEAFLANRGHGLPLTTEDRKVYARWLHRHHPDWSLRKIGRESGLNHDTVRRALQAETATQPKKASKGQPPAVHVISLIAKQRRLSVDEVQGAIEQYEEKDRVGIAQELLETGRALVEAASRYVKG